MPTGTADSIRAAVRRVLAAAPTDAELLAAFALARDPVAFEALVRRHGPLVAAVCRAILVNPADADDAAQATFLVLARKAGALHATNLPGWLFRVARRAALEVKRANDRRRIVEARGARIESATGPDISWREAVAILHTELARLPAKYRDPLVLCYLDGRPRDEAATALGCSVDALRGRLDQGRAKLGARLKARGVALSAGLLAVTTGPGIAPAEVVRNVLRPSATVEAVAKTIAGSARGWAVGSIVAAMLVLGAVLVGTGAADPPAKADPPKTAGPKLDAHGDPLPDGAVARLGTVRFHHGYYTGPIRYTPDGKHIIASEWNGTFRVWDAETGRELRSGRVPQDGGVDVVLRSSDDPEVLVVPIALGSSVHWYDTRRRAVTRTYALPSGGGARILSPDGRRLAARHGEGDDVHDLETGKRLATIPDRASRDRREGDRVGIVFAGPDRLAVIVDREIRISDATTGRHRRSITPSGPVIELRASADGRVLVAVEHQLDDTVLSPDWSKPERVRVWDIETGTEKHALPVGPKRWLTGLAVSANGRVLAATAARPTGDHETTVWDLTTGKVLCVVENRTGRDPVLRPDGARLWVGGRVWEVPSGKRVWPAEGVHDRAAGLYLSPTGDLVVSMGYLSAGVWDGATGRLVRPLSVPSFIYGCDRTVSPDGRSAVTYAPDELVLWDVETDRRRWEVKNLAGVTAFSPDSSILAARMFYPESPVELRRVSDGTLIRSFPTPGSGGARRMAFTADGGTLFVIGEKVARYAVATGTELGSWPRPKFPAFPAELARGGDQQPTSEAGVSPDGSLIAFHSPRPRGETGVPSVLVFDARTGTEFRRWADDQRPGADARRWADEGETWKSGPMAPPAFTSDGRVLATADGPRVTVWETATGRKLRTFDGHTMIVERLVVSGNGRRLGSTSLDDTVLIWDLSVPLPAKLDPTAWWADLLSDEPAKAWAAVWHLVDAPEDVALPVIRDHLKPATAADVESIRQAIGRLDHDKFAVRERATAELAKLGHQAGPALRAALAAKPSAEARQRIDGLLEKIIGPPESGEPLRIGRALAALERKGTPGAKKLLKELAAGVEGAWLTTEARAALGRLP